MNRLLSVGDQIGSGVYRFHSRFHRVVNFERDGHLVSIVDGQIGPGPMNIVLRCRTPHLRTVDTFAVTPARRGDAPAGAAGFSAGDEAAGAERFPSLEITPTSVFFAARRLPFTSRQRYRSTLDSRPGNPGRFEHNLSLFRELLIDSAPARSLVFLLDETRLKNFRSASEQAFTRRIRGGVREVFLGRMLKGIRALKGCGLGLTPSGDDFIAGVLIGLNFLQTSRGRLYQPTADAIFDAARGDNIFSNSFLSLACRGLLFGRMKDLLQALQSGSPAAVRKATARLLAIGASSGADLATGFLMTVQGQGAAVEGWRAETPSSIPRAQREPACKRAGKKNRGAPTSL